MEIREADVFMKNVSDRLAELLYCNIDINNIINNNFNLYAKKTIGDVLLQKMIKICRNEIIKVKKLYQAQIPITIDRINGNISKSKFNRKVLKYDYFYQNSNKSIEFKEDLIKYYNTINNLLKLLINSGSFKLQIDNNNIKKKIRKTLSRGEIYKKHNNEISLEKTKLGKTVDYTNEAISSLSKSENIVYKEIFNNSIDF